MSTCPLASERNWSRRGGIERDVRAVDVSPTGDWRLLKVRYGPIGGLGTSAKPAHGFIYGDAAPADDQPTRQPRDLQWPEQIVMAPAVPVAN